MRPAAWRYLMPLQLLPLAVLMATWVTAAQDRGDGPAARGEARLNGSR